MKNIAIALNAVLFVLIVALFFMYSSLKKRIEPSKNSSFAETSVNQGPLRIAYINDDSIDAHYKLMSDIQARMQESQNIIQNEYNTKAQALQQEYAVYQQKAQSGNISQIGAEKAQKDLQQKKSELDDLQSKMNDLEKEMQQQNVLLVQKVSNYVTKYNKTAGYDYILTYASLGSEVLYANQAYDITHAILSGLNKQYEDSLQGKTPQPPAPVTSKLKKH